MKLQASPLLPAFAALTMLALIFLTLEASFLARAGRVAEATILGNAATAIIFFIVAGTLIIFGVKIGAIQFIRLSEVDIFRQNIGQSARDFILGVIIFYLIGTYAPANSVFNFSALTAVDDPFSAAASLSDPYWSSFITTLATPVAEEFLFYIALPVILLMVIRMLAQQFDIKALQNLYVQYAIAGGADAFVFAAFHIGQGGLVAFFIAAMLFRFILVMLKTDVSIDSVPGVVTGWAFAVGGHIANNIAATGGFVKWWLTLIAPPNNFALFSSVFAIVLLFGVALLGVNQVAKQTTGSYLFKVHENA